MRRPLLYRLVLLALVWLSACKAEEGLAPTQIMLRVYSGELGLTQQLSQLRVSVALAEGSGFRAAVSKRFERAALRWPVDVPVLPHQPEDAFKQFEVVVEALDGARVLAQTRAIASFVPGEKRLLDLTLYSCPDTGSGVSCASSACSGMACDVCTAERACAPVIPLRPSDLRPFDGQVGGDDARDASPDASPDASLDSWLDAGEAGAPDSGTDAAGEGRDTSVVPADVGVVEASSGSDANTLSPGDDTGSNVDAALVTEAGACAEAGQSCSDPCLPNPCLHGGSCSRSAASYSCDCAGTSYAGATCDTLTGGCGNVYFLIDRSTSMEEALGTVSRWQVVTAGLGQLLQQDSGAFAKKLNYGAGAFPADTNICTASGLPKELVVTGAHASSMLPAALDALGLRGTTPTDLALAGVRERRLTSVAGDSLASRPKAVVLITDGEPNDCETANANSRLTQTISESAALAAAGVPVYVLGLGPVSAAALQSIADAGDPAPGTNVWYNVSSESSMLSALNAVLQRMGCPLH
jgi:hypothetical protein